MSDKTACRAVKPLSTGNIEGKLKRKRNLYLSFIRKYPGIFRQECAKRMQISTFNSTKIAGSLIDNGLISEKQSELTGNIPRGRPTLPLYINPDYEYFAGIDFEANRWRFAIINFAGNLIYSQTMPFVRCQNRKEYITQLQNLLISAIDTCGKSWNKVSSLGIATPGFLDKTSSVIQRYEILPWFIDIPIREIYAEISGKPVSIINNTATLALYDNWKHPAVAQKIILYVAIRSGISAVLNIYGKIYRGNQGKSGELGLSFTGDNKFLQDIAGLNALEQQVQTEHSELWKNSLKITDKIYNLNKKIFDDALVVIVTSLVNNAAMLAPDKIVIHSSLFTESGILWQQLEKKFNSLRKQQHLPPLPLEHADNSSELNEAVGVALFAMESMYTI